MDLQNPEKALINKQTQQKNVKAEQWNPTYMNTLRW